MKTETLKAIINAFNAASTDETRFNINHIRLIRTDSGLVRVEASDGYILSTVDLEDETFAADIGKTEYAVSPDTLPYLKLVLKNCKGMTEINHVKQDDGSIVIADGNAAGTIRTAKRCNVEFPRFDQVKANPAADAFSVSLNVEYLENLLKALREDNRQKVVKLTFGKGNVDPIAVSVAGQTGTIMPCRH